VSSTTYADAGDTLSFEVEFSEVVSWTNASNVSFDFTIGTATTATATTTAINSNTNNKVIFTYDVLAGQTGAVAIPASTNLNVANGDSIVDAAGNTMSTLPLQTLSGNATIDTTAPTVSMTIPYTQVGVPTQLTATFSEPLYNGTNIITNANASSFSIISSSGATIANITVGSSAQSITFTYTPNSTADTITISATNSITDRAGNALTSGSFTLTPNACFPAGTPIQTDQGIVPIEQINIIKNTIRGYKIKALIHSYLTDSHMVLFKKNSLYNNVPSKDTVMSRYHKVYYNKRMGYAKDFVEMGIAQYKNYPKYTPIFNLLLESHENMIINNMIVETQNPQSTTGRFYNDFILNKNIKPKDIHYAHKLFLMFHETTWAEELIHTDLSHLDHLKDKSDKFMVKEWFKAYLIQNKNKNKKRVIKIMNKLLPISK
jgi:hypothetical protein